GRNETSQRGRCTNTTGPRRGVPWSVVWKSLKESGFRPGRERRGGWHVPCSRGSRARRGGRGNPRMNQQRTVRRTVGIEGVGLHSGAETRVEILPAPANHGLLFVRRDLGGKVIPASPE